MCEDHPADLGPTRLTRRRLLGGSAALAVGAVAGPFLGHPAASAAVRPVSVMPGLEILPREAWGADLPPRAKAPVEKDVRLLLVHHTASPNTWSAEHTMQVAYMTHVHQKGWVDVCYNLFVARDGTVYEGRAGSLARPRRADATGGSQGYSQLVCLLGDYSNEMPTAAAQASLVKALAWLALRSDVDTTRGSTCTFRSLGSNRFPAGTRVTSPTIAPHRAMTFTSCPGDTFAPKVNARLMRAVQRQRVAWRNANPSSAVRLGSAGS